MLRHLYIKNYTLIDELDIDFQPGFSVITGETGAGKSIILGAIGLLLGNRADSKQIKQGEKKCTIEAQFSLDNTLEDFFTENSLDFDADETIIRRELTAAGKSRGFINDTPVALPLLRQLGERLIDVHSQHQNLLLQDEDFQMNVIDIIAQDKAELHSYQSKFADYHELQKRLSMLKQQIADAQKNEEFMRFQYKELCSADITEGIQEELEQESETLSHSEEIKTSLYESSNLLNGDEQGVIQSIKSAASSLRQIEDVYPKVHELAERLESSHIELKDIAEELSNDVDNVEFDPSRLDSINTHLDTIYSLQQKFHVSTDKELIALREDLKQQLHNIDNSDEELSMLEQHVAQAEKACRDEASKLTAIRKKAAAKVEKEMQERLIPLGIPNVRFQVQFVTDAHAPLTSNGTDNITFLFSANKSTALQPVSEVASGGEIARVMLSLKAMISGAVDLPTIIFDEIDTGVSGKIAQKMADIMQEMASNNRQVLSITHLPQIASAGTTHYKVEKEETDLGTISRMRILSHEERIGEIAQMLSGDDISEAAITNAKELLRNE